MKTIKSILKLLILTLAFTTVSCDDEPVDPALDLSNGGGSASGDYWPTAINNEWIMERGGVELDPIKIIGTGNFGGQTYYKFAPQSGSGSTSSGSVTNWLNKSNGVYKLKTDDININVGGLTGTQTGYEFVILKDNNPYYNGYVKRAVKKNYKGNYLLVKESEFYSNKFSDVDKYRFVFDFSEGRSYSNMTNTGYSSGSYKRFFVKDRLHNKTYQVMEDFNFFVKAMHIYFANLELKRTTTN